MPIKYTDTKDNAIEYVEKRFEEYLSGKTFCEKERQQTKKRFEEERDFLNRKLEQYPRYVEALWMAIFLGEQIKTKDIMVRNRLDQCPFIMYLLRLASYNILEEGFLNQSYLYRKSNISFFDYSVSENFYEEMKGDMATFFADSGYDYLWIGQESVLLSDARTANGLVVFPKGEDVINYRAYCGRLIDGNICFLEEYLPEIEDECAEFRFERNEKLSVEEELFLKYFKPENRKDMANVLAYTQIVFPYEKPDVYYQKMIAQPYPIFTREDLWNLLRMKGVFEEKAYYWTEVIRKGKLKRLVEEERLPLPEWKELNEILGEELVELFYLVMRLPSKWNVLERVCQCEKRLSLNGEKLGRTTHGVPK